MDVYCFVCVLCVSLRVVPVLHDVFRVVVLENDIRIVEQHN